jgi:hypothetical protein
MAQEVSIPNARIPNAQVRAANRSLRANTMTFPQELRDAIPVMQPCWGRILQLSSIDGDCQHNLRGRRVGLKFLVEETGKLSGVFPVYADLDVEAARTLAATLLNLVEQVEQLPQKPTYF